MESEEQLKLKTDMLAGDFVRAMAEAIKKAGSQKNMSEATGIHQSRISDYANGNYDFSNLTIGSLIRMFPDLSIVYFPQNGAPTCSDAIRAIESRMLTMFWRLNVDDQVRCFEMMSRTFGERFKEAE